MYEVHTWGFGKTAYATRQQALKAAHELSGYGESTWPMVIVAVKCDGSKEIAFNPETQIIKKNGKTGKRGVRNKKKEKEI